MQQMAKVGVKEVEHGTVGFHEQLLGEPGIKEWPELLCAASGS